MATASESHSENKAPQAPIKAMVLGAVGIVATAAAFVIFESWLVGCITAFVFLVISVLVGLYQSQRVNNSIATLHAYLHRIELGQLETATKATNELLEETPEVSGTASIAANIATRLYNAAQHLEYPEAHPLHPASRQDLLFTAIEESVSEADRLNRQYTALQEVSSSLSILPRIILSATTPNAFEDELCHELMEVLGASYVCFYRSIKDENGHTVQVERTSARNTVSLFVHSRTFGVRDCLVGDALQVRRMKHYARPPKQFESRTCAPTNFHPVELLALPITGPDGDLGAIELGTLEPIPAKALEGLETASKAIGIYYAMLCENQTPKAPAFNPETWASEWLETSRELLVAVLPANEPVRLSDKLASLIATAPTGLETALRNGATEYTMPNGGLLKVVGQKQAGETDTPWRIFWLEDTAPAQEIASLKARQEAQTAELGQKAQDLSLKEQELSRLQLEWSRLQSEHAQTAQQIAALNDQLAEANTQKAALEQEMERALLAATESGRRAQDVENLRAEYESVLRALNSAAVVSETDAQGRITRVNEAFLNLCRYSRAEVIGQNHRLLKSGHQPDAIFQEMWATLAKGSVWTGELKNRAKDGTYYWLSCTLAPIIGVGGTTLKYLSIASDITPQKVQEEQLKSALKLSQTQEAEIKETAKELQRAYDEMRQAQQASTHQLEALDASATLFELDTKGIIRKCNDRLPLALGLEKTDLLGHQLREVLSTAEGNIAQALETLVGGQAWSGILKPSQNHQNPGIWVNINPVLDFNLTPTKHIAVGFGLSVVPAPAPVALQDSDAPLLRTIGQTVYVVQTTESGEIDSINPTLASALGYDVGELLGKPLADLLKTDEALGIGRELKNALNATMLWRIELPLVTKQGHTLWVQAALSTLPGQEGKGRLLVGHNISQAKLLEAKVEELSGAYERTQAEATERTEQLQNVFANVPGIIYQREAKPGYPIRLLNDQILNTLGYPVEDFGPGGTRSFYDLIHPDDLPRVLNELEHSLNRYEPYRIIYRVRNRVQAIRWVQDEGRGVFDSMGHLLHCDGVIFDISQQKTLESNLRQSSTLLKQQQMELAGQIKALNNAALVSESDAKGIITYVNDEASHLWGYSRSELIGQTHSLLKSTYHSESFYERMWEEIAAGNVWKGEIVNKTKSGEELWCILTISPVLDVNRKPFKYIAVAVDITRQKRQAARILDVLNEVKHHEQELMDQAQNLEEAQRELLETHLELEARIQAMNHSAIVSETDLNGFIRFVNEEASHIWGYERHELLGKPHSIISSGYHKPEFWQEMWRTLSAGNPWSGPVLNRAKDGREFWVQLSITPVLDVQGQPTKYIGIAFDITQQRVQAERIRRALKESEQRENSYRTELEALRTQGHDALPQVAEMSRALLLELPTPVLLVGGNAQILAHNTAFEAFAPEAGLDPQKVMQQPAARMGQKARPLEDWLSNWPADSSDTEDLFLERNNGQAWAVITIVPTREAFFGFRFALHARPIDPQSHTAEELNAQLQAQRAESSRLRSQLAELEETVAQEVQHLAENYERALSAQSFELDELRRRLAALN